MKLHITIPISPGALAINKARRAHVSRGGKPGTHKAPAYRAAFAKTVALLRVARGARSFTTGPVAVSLSLHWPRTNRIGPAEGLACGDIDAPIKGILDACTAAGVWTDDAQVVSLSVAQFVDPHNPRIMISIHD